MVVLVVRHSGGYGRHFVPGEREPPGADLDARELGETRPRLVA